ncbi:MAG TPA: 3-phosphoshikimate 1-carboxyvinyltransferase [Gaiellaceae bacterium]|nr:3-phosphoshikimate 1-carboxyvinyltransferase [Gaiellaceae bacterium]
MRIEPAVALEGAIAVPGDKSISHRSVLLGALCDGETRVRGFGRSGDTESSIRAVRALGAEVVEEDVDTLTIRGAGVRGLQAPAEPIDCGNSGTTVRLLAGILAGQRGRFELTGDASLSRRPMERIAEPLRRMGAGVETTEGHLPLTIAGSDLAAIDYALPVASAQVKSAVLLAGLNAEGRTTVVEPLPTRDHTEIMLRAAGAPVVQRPGSASVDRARRLELGELEVPGDFSSAAPFVVAATLLAGSELVIQGVGLNPRRTGLLDVLERMGARIAVFNRRRAGGEPVGDLQVRSAELVATRVEPEEVPLLVDELPLFALAAAHARGDSEVSGAAELRVKETDRIETVTTALRALGIRAEERDDGFRVRGVPTRPRGGGVDPQGDHRIAMLGAVAGLASREGVELREPEAVAVSFPGFFDLLAQVAQKPGDLR